MVSNELNNCPMCGSPAVIDSTGSVECYGWAWQTITIECTDTAGKHCGMNIQLQADFSYTDDAWWRLIKLWNEL